MVAGLLLHADLRRPMQMEPLLAKLCEELELVLAYLSTMLKPLWSLAFTESESSWSWTCS